MILNYFKLAFRLLLRNPFLTIINVAGLSIGLATFLMLWPLAEFELNSDKFHKDADRILHVGVDYRWKDVKKGWNSFIGGFNWVGPIKEIEETFNHVESSCWIIPQIFYGEGTTGFNPSVHLSIISDSGEKELFRETSTSLASQNLFNFFSIPVIRGNSETVLSTPNSVVLSRTMSVKYFGDGDAIGKTIYLNDSIPLKVTGIFEDLPHNTHLTFQIVISAEHYPGIYIKDMSKWHAYTYLKLKKGSSIESFNQELARHQESIYEFTKQSCDHCEILPRAQRLTDVVFSKLRASDYNYKSKFLLEALAIVAFTVIGFAWINYISLSVAALNKRLHEIGTRKSVGAVGKDFLLQFLIESFLMNVISFGIAITLVQLLTRLANEWFGFYIPTWGEMSFKTTVITLITLGLGVAVATLCPLAMIIKRRPTDLFKKFRSNIKSGNFSATLVTVQYSVATILLVWIGAVYFQLNFILKKDVGIHKEGLIVAEAPLALTSVKLSSISSFLTESKRILGVQNVATSFSTIADPDDGGINVQSVGSNSWFGADTNGGVDESFINTFDIDLVAGRNFQADNPADQKSILISVAATRRLGLDKPQDAIGKNLIAFRQDQRTEVQVIGVFNDYEFRPFFSHVTERDRGVVLTYKNYAFPEFKPMKMTFRVDIQKVDNVLESIEALYDKTFQEPMKWTFLDEKLRKQYADDHAIKNQLLFFSLLAVGITCLGLLGMISNKVVEKTKEIGIRKVLGARMHQIGVLLLNTTVRQVIVANSVGIPLAYYLVQQYLEKFSERLEMKWWHYTTPAIMLIIIMLATVASVLYKAARTNPTESLRYE